MPSHLGYRTFDANCWLFSLFRCLPYSDRLMPFCKVDPMETVRGIVSLLRSYAHIQMDAYSISQEICTRFLLCCALLWLYIDWFFPYPSGLLHWHCGNLTISPVPAKQPWWIWMNTSREFIMNDCITTTKQSTTKPCAYFLGYTVHTTIRWILC